MLRRRSETELQSVPQKKLSLPRLVLYWCAQFGGAIVGSLFVRATYKTGASCQPPLGLCPTCNPF